MYADWRIRYHSSKAAGRSALEAAEAVVAQAVDKAQWADCKQVVQAAEDEEVGAAEAADMAAAYILRIQS